MIWEVALIIVVNLFRGIFSVIGWVIPSAWIEQAEKLVIDFYESGIILFSHFMTDYAVLSFVLWMNFILSAALIYYIYKGVKAIRGLFPT